MSPRKEDEELERNSHLARRYIRGPQGRALQPKDGVNKLKEDGDDNQAKLEELQRNISSLENKIDEIQGKINHLGDKITSIPPRLSEIRNSGYKSLVYLDGAGKHLYDTWMEDEPEIRTYASRRIESLRDRMAGLTRDLSRARVSEHFKPSRLEHSIDGVRTDIRDLDDQFDSLLQKYSNAYKSLDDDLRIAEKTMEYLASSSLDWKQGEHPLLSVEAEDMDRDVEGYIILTNHRFIFEKEEEIALKKTWFIVTEKKKVRNIVLEEPIGSLDDMFRGRVGLLKGAGIYVKFKDDTRLNEIKYDTTGEDADRLIRFFKFIISGEAEKELEMQVETLDDEDEVPITCNYCGAPYTDEVYRGQTTLRCSYCGSMINL
jgi:hypothetical protein